MVRDLHCAAALSRRFSWEEVNLFPSELPHNTTVVLSGADNLIPAADIKLMLVHGLPWQWVIPRSKTLTNTEGPRPT